MTPFQGPMAACFRGQIPRILPLNYRAGPRRLRLFKAGFLPRRSTDHPAHRALRWRARNQRDRAAFLKIDLLQPRPEGVQLTQMDELPLTVALLACQVHRLTAAPNGTPQGTDLVLGPAREGARVGCMGSLCFFVHTL